jgi:hypothetical protein
MYIEQNFPVKLLKIVFVKVTKRLANFSTRREVCEIEDAGNSPPVQCRPYRTSPKMKAEIDRQLDEMLKYGIIEESVSNNRSPIVMVKRKTTLDTKNPEFRLCVDYRDC